MTGYSGTPLAKKLGIKAGFKIGLINPPDNYYQLFIDLPSELYFEGDGTEKDLIHFFTSKKDELLLHCLYLKLK
jgi:hypothetical protein